MTNHRIEQYLLNAKDFFASADLSAGVSISAGNKKLGSIPSFSLPPITTCEHCVDCKNQCYAVRMAMRHKSTLVAWARNHAIWHKDKARVERAITASALTHSYFRYFTAGDIPSAEFFDMMIRIAERVPTCKFLVFTKKYYTVQRALDERNGELPSNLIVILSKWGDWDALQTECRNPYNLPTSNVIFKGAKDPVDARICGGNCYDCICRGIGCWELKLGDSIYFYEH